MYCVTLLDVEGVDQARLLFCSIPPIPIHHQTLDRTFVSFEADTPIVQDTLNAKLVLGSVEINPLIGFSGTAYADTTCKKAIFYTLFYYSY